MSNPSFRESVREARRARVGILPNLASPPPLPPRKPDFWRRWPRLRSSRRATDEQIAAAIAATRDFVRDSVGGQDIEPELLRDIRALVAEAGALSQALHVQPPRVSDAGPATHRPMPEIPWDQIEQNLAQMRQSLDSSAGQISPTRVKWRVWAVLGVVLLALVVVLRLNV